MADTTASTSSATEGPSFLAAWLLALLLGFVGADRFYLGKYPTAALKLGTVGGLGIWWLVDVILILAGVTRDADGRLLVGGPPRPLHWALSVLAIAAFIAGGMWKAPVPGIVSCCDTFVTSDGWKVLLEESGNGETESEPFLSDGSDLELQFTGFGSAESAATVQIDHADDADSQHPVIEVYSFNDTTGTYVFHALESGEYVLRVHAKGDWDLILSEQQ
jgi:hypothetical protein